MPTIKRQSLRDVLFLQDRMNKVLEDSLKSIADQTGPGEWTPYADIYENDHAITIKTELPGISREDIMIDIGGSVLSVSGNKKRLNEDRADVHHIIERQYGSFKRTFSIPAGIDIENINACFENGILEITLLREKTSITKKINISRG